MSKENSLLLPELREKCGVFGMITPGEDAFPYVRLGLANLQHRGQTGSGIATSDGSHLHHKSGEGYVMQTFQDDFDYRTNLPGEIAEGHTSYPTSRASKDKRVHLQPVMDEGGLVAFAHNGNLADTSKLERFMDKKGIPNNGYNDSEMMQAGVAYEMKKGAPLEEAVAKMTPHFTGSYSALFMDKSKIVAIRDPRGIRPLSIGSQNGSYAFSSETCAFSSLGISHVRDVSPGEMVILDGNRIRSEILEKGKQKLDIFELIYFARPDSELLGQSVKMVRERLGINLAREMKAKNIDADIVIGVPNSGIPSAIGFAHEADIKYDEAIIKNLYVGRTFIGDDETREANINLKLNPIRAALQDKDVIVVDDSIVRGKTSIALVKMLRRNGVRRLHLAIPSPEVLYPDFYGIDTPRQEELFAYMHKTPKERELALGVDSLTYLSYQGMIDATGLSEKMFSTSAFTGKYPIDIGKWKSKVDWSQR